MNALKTAALAITLIIAIPILLGFGMASETVEKEVLQESDQVSLSDIILNSTTDYYMTYSGPQNNSTFIQKLVAQGGYEYAQASPDYVSVGSTVTSLPTYESASGSVTLDDGTTVTHSGDTSVELWVGDYDSGTVYNHDYITITNTDGVLCEYRYYVDGSYSGYITYSTTPFTFFRSGSDSDGNPLYTFTRPDGTVIEDVDTFYIYSNQTPTFTVYYLDATEISIDSNYYTMSLSGDATVPVTYTDGTTDYYYFEDLSSLVYLSSHLYLDDTRIDNVGSYGLCIPSYVTLTYTYSVIVSDGYADPSEGWALPIYDTSSGSGVNSYYDYWMNGYVNSAVAFDVAFSDSGTVYFAPMDSLESTADFTLSLIYDSSDGLSFVYDSTTYTVGAYDHARVIIDEENETLTVYGLKSWAAMGVSPTVFNSQSVDIDRGEFAVVYMQDTSAVATFRVDSARIVAGEFPSTEDYTLTVTDLYPDVEHYSLYFNSVGIYGDSITIAGATVSAPLHDTVTVDYDEDSGSWAVLVDGTEYTSSAAPSLYFEGEWSITLTCTTYEYVTITENEWIPGAFAFDKDDFLLAVILATVGVFVALGLAKGTKIGVLAVVCGAAGIIAFMIA